MTTAMLDRRALEDLKIAVLAAGVRLTDEARSLIAGMSGGILSIHEYPTTGGVTLELEDGVYINAPFDGPFDGVSGHLLSAEGGVLRIEGPDASFDVVRVLPLPGYLGQLDDEGDRVDEVAMSHADRVRLSPIVGCAYRCRFCDLGAMDYVRRGSVRLLHALDVACSDAALPPRHALISGGSPRRAQYDEFITTCEEVIRASPVLVDVMFSPMIDRLDIVDRLVDAGAAGFAINLELYSEAASRSELGAKFLTSRKHFEATVQRAVERLGRTGRVRSLIIPGLEPIEETLHGVEYLASLGCDPVLSPFRPAEGTELVDHAPPPPGLLRDVLDESRRIVASHGVSLGPDCVPCQHNTLTFPWDVREIPHVPSEPPDGVGRL